MASSPARLLRLAAAFACLAMVVLGSPRTADAFSTRVHMWHIGVRDEARRLDGIGRCGRQFCSSSWLPELRPVKSSTAKDQRLSTLNPAQISGTCGRLMCCLRHEHEFYVQSRKRFPKEGKVLLTSMGEEKVASNDLMLAALQTSFIVAFTSAALATIMGTMAALALQRVKGAVRTLFDALIYIAIMVPGIVIGIATLIALVTTFDAVNTVLAQLWPGDAPPKLGMGYGSIIPAHTLFSMALVTMTGVPRCLATLKAFLDFAWRGTCVPECFRGITAVGITFTTTTPGGTITMGAGIIIPIMGITTIDK